MMATFAERLKELRKKKGLTQKELAEKLGVVQGSYGNWEKGKREPNIDKLIELAWELDSSLDYMLGQSDLNLGRNKDIEENIQYDPYFSLLPDEEAEVNARIEEINDDFVKKYNTLTPQNLRDLVQQIQKANEDVRKKHFKDHTITYHTLRDDFTPNNGEALDNIASNNLETNHSKSYKTDDNEQY